MKAAIIGCGLIGTKRAATLGNVQLTACADLDQKRAEQLASLYPNCRPYTDWHLMLKKVPFDIAIIATIHSELFPIGHAMIEANKHILTEKPAGLNAKELKMLVQLAKNKNVCARVGYNHRFHRAFQKAKSLIDEGALGELMFLRARYGHGGRIGYNQEWRADPSLSGGGELIDQGVHLIDLSRWILGDFSEVQGFAHTYYWDMPVEDNGFLMLKTPSSQVAILHASCTEWKNLFSFEIYGKMGKLSIEGLGGSYGTEKLSYYKMLKAMGPPETIIWEYPMADNSWQTEWDAFIQDITQNTVTGATLEDAMAALNIVEQTYSHASV